MKCFRTIQLNYIVFTSLEPYNVLKLTIIKTKTSHLIFIVILENSSIVYQNNLLTLATVFSTPLQNNTHTCSLPSLPIEQVLQIYN